VFADAVAAPYHHDDVTLWRSDGTPGGTTQVAGTVYERSPYAGDLGAEPDRYVFVAGRGNPEIPRLWQTDGTAAGTRTVTDQNLARFPDVREVETAGAATWFVARTPQLRYEVFHKSGAAVSQVTRIEQSRRPDVHQISAVGSRLMFFLERDGVDQLWVTDHSTRGAHRVGSDSWTRHSVRPANTSGGTLVFVGQRGAQSGMWRSDGTAAGTFALIKGRAVADRSVARRTAAAGSTTDARPLVASATASPRAADNRSAPADRTCAGRSATIVATGGKVRGTSGPDVIVVNISDTAGGTTEVSAGAGKDVVCIAFEAPDPEENVIGRSTVHGGKGDDQIFGSDGWDDLSGDQGNDYLYGGAANDTFDGGRGSDVLDGSFAYYFEGRNNDQAVVTGVGHVDLDLDRGFVHTARGTDLITGISNVVTGSGDDVVRGDADANRLLGGAGNDQLLGRGGDDVLDGQAGRDRVVGGAGHDVCRGEKRASCEKR
jgi:Ca2+-binding RTX toxin-like protein